MVLTADSRANNNYNRGMDFTSIVAINGAAIQPMFFNNGIRE